MNVTELVRKLKITKEEFFPLAQELGFDIGVRAIKVDDAVADKIVTAIQEKKRREGKRSLFADHVVPKKQEAEGIPSRVLHLPPQLTVKAFAEKLSKPVTDTIAILMQNGIMATINENLDFETATIIAQDLGYTTERIEPEEKNQKQDTSEVLGKLLAEDDSKKLSSRPPVVVVMGHVDHGKTKLLDAIRKTQVMEQEAGGITQHIGAYQVEHDGKWITFIDTPGHEAFSAMRSRGARVADLAILVIAADDGIKPQTVEAIEILEKAELPFIVAINKIDKPEADVDRVKKDLSQFNLIPEDWGGKTICVPISAKQNIGINDLLEMVLLLADIEREHIVANPSRDAVGTIIESHIDKGKGPVVTALIQAGTLRVGDVILVGDTFGKVKALYDWNGKTLGAARPSQPTQILGLKQAPVVGDILRVTKDKKILKQKVREYKRFSDVVDQKKEKRLRRKVLSVILRADTLGSLEAIVESLKKLGTDDLRIDVLNQGLGNVTEKDIALAESTGGHIFGFHVSVGSSAQQLANQSSLNIQIFTIIYELLDAVKKHLETLLEPETVFTKMGKIKLLATFKSGAGYQIVGGKVVDGFVQNQSPVKVYRNGETIGEGLITQLQQEKKNVSKVTSGAECGIKFETSTVLQVGDELEVYEKQLKARSL